MTENCELTTRLAVAVRYVVVDLSSWSAPPPPFHERALASLAPHGLDCACLMCADERRHIGVAMAETELGALCRAADEASLGVEQIRRMERHAPGY